MSFQNFFVVLSRVFQGIEYNTFSHFKCLRSRHNAMSRVTCCPRTTGWADMIYTEQA